MKTFKKTDKPKTSTHGFFATEYVVDMATGEMKRAPLGPAGKWALILVLGLVAAGANIYTKGTSEAAFGTFLIAVATTAFTTFNLFGINYRGKKMDEVVNRWFPLKWRRTIGRA